VPPVPAPPSSGPGRPEAGARRSLRARLAGGPLARRIGLADLAVYRAVRTRGRHPALDGAVRVYSGAGEHALLWYAIALVGLAADGRRREDWMRAIGAVLLTQLVNTTLKAVFNRRRPALEDLPPLVRTPTSLSFPSAHASTSFAAARALRPLVPTPVAAALYPAAAAMAASRVVLGVHYPTDVAVGAALGAACGSAGRA
jgi:membrane-associated phospholipid phosphatase